MVVKQVSDIYNTKYVKLQTYKEMVIDLLMYFDDYQNKNIPRDNNRYTNTMDNIASFSPINIEDEETIIEIKNWSIPSHAYVVIYNTLL